MSRRAATRDDLTQDDDHHQGAVTAQGSFAATAGSVTFPPSQQQRPRIPRALSRMPEVEQDRILHTLADTTMRLRNEYESHLAGSWFPVEPLEGDALDEPSSDEEVIDGSGAFALQAASPPGDAVGGSFVRRSSTRTSTFAARAGGGGVGRGGGGNEVDLSASIARRLSRVSGAAGSRAPGMTSRNLVPVNVTSRYGVRFDSFQHLYITLASRSYYLHTTTILLQLFAVALAYAFLVLCFGAPMIPGGAVFDAVAIVIFSSIVGGILSVLLQLPPLIGILLSAIAWANIADHTLVSGIQKSITGPVKTVGLAMILLRGGINIDINILRPVWRNALILALLPLTLDMAINSVIVLYAFNYPSYSWALLHAATTAPLSASVIVGGVLQLQSLGRGTFGGPLVLMLSAVPFDSSLGIFTATFLQKIVLNNESMVNAAWLAPAEILGGLLGGALMGWALEAVQDSLFEERLGPGGTLLAAEPPRPSHAPSLTSLPRGAAPAGSPTSAQGGDYGSTDAAFPTIVPAPLQHQQVSPQPQFLAAPGAPRSGASFTTDASAALLAAGSGPLADANRRSTNATFASVSAAAGSPMSLAERRQLAAALAQAGVSQTNKARAEQRATWFFLVVILLCGTVVESTKRYEIEGVGTCFCVALGATLAHKWNQHPAKRERKAAFSLIAANLWNMAALPALFSFVGASVRLNEILAGTFLWKGVCAFLGSAGGRAIGSTIAGIGTDLSKKERLVLCLSWIGKATSQATLGGMVFDRVQTELAKAAAGSERRAELERQLVYGRNIANASVMMILMAAPIAVLSLRNLGRKWVRADFDE